MGRDGPSSQTTTTFNISVYRKGKRGPEKAKSCPYITKADSGNQHSQLLPNHQGFTPKGAVLLSKGPLAMSRRQLGVS